MRTQTCSRLLRLLVGAGLVVAPLGAAAGPSPDSGSPSPAPQVHRFEWSESSTIGRARLGVMVMSLTPELRSHFGAKRDRGVLVARVEPGSPAATAGIAVGDVLVEVRGTAVDSAGDVLEALAPVKQGDLVALAVIRAGRPVALSATLTGTSGAARADAMWPSWIEEMMRSFREHVRPPERTTRT